MIGGSPWTREEHLALSLAGLVELLRAVELAERRRLAIETRALLSDEEERLKALAEARLADLRNVAIQLDAVPRGVP